MKITIIMRGRLFTLVKLTVNCATLAMRIKVKHLLMPTWYRRLGAPIKRALGTNMNGLIIDNTNVRFVSRARGIVLSLEGPEMFTLFYLSIVFICTAALAQQGTCVYYSH